MRIVGSRFYLKGKQENDMRGDDKKSEGMFCYISAESVVPKDDPLRPIRTIADKALQERQRERGEAFVYGARAYGEQEWSDYRHRAYLCDRDSGARCGN